MSMIQIQLSLDPASPLTSAVLHALAAIAEGPLQNASATSAPASPDTVAPPAEEKKPRRTKAAEAAVVVPPSPAAPAAAPAPAPSPAPAPAAAPGSLLTRDQVAGVVTKAMAILGAEGVQACFQKVGKLRLSAMDASEYPKLVAALTEAIAAKEAGEGMLS